MDTKDIINKDDQISMNNMIKDIKPFIELYDTARGIYLQGTPNVPVDKFFTGIILLIQHMVENGHKLDDILAEIRKNVARHAVEKVIQ